MTIDDLRAKGLIIMECISGSRAYGLATPSSDTDIKGVFLLPKDEYYGLNYIPQVNNETNDIVFYELGRFMELLSLNNPNILELLNTPYSAILFKHPYLNDIKSKHILSRLCNNTFGKFALSQIKKAKGLKKKIVNPVAKERKSVLSFCFVNYDQGAIPLLKYLQIKGWQQEYCGLVNIPHMKDVYGLYYSDQLGFSGVIRGKESKDVCLSSIPKGTKQEAIMYFNRDGYSAYCKEYREYWNWVDKRNNARYENTKSHGKNYDSKNMMHVFRLLEMAIEIGQEGKVNVLRPNREFLLAIKAGKFEYDELLKMADLKQAEMELAFENSSLPDKPDLELINKLTYRLRDKFYKDRE
ncbi:MAG: nucleotidyltransferase domain-containing protein [Bacteroidales bacterium]|nr:nucleotidyltransferase domain-containing protein [Bacteroidales bacterium]